MWKSCNRQIVIPTSILSSAGHEKSCMNLPGPSGKAKYSWETDSEPVPWGKGEKYPKQGSEIVLETIRLQAVGAHIFIYVVWRRAFCIMILRVTFVGQAKRFSRGAEAKASLNRAQFESAGVDAKPSDLPLSRLKVE